MVSDLAYSNLKLFLWLDPTGGYKLYCLPYNMCPNIGFVASCQPGNKFKEGLPRTHSECMCLHHELGVVPLVQGILREGTVQIRWITLEWEQGL